MKYLSVCAGIEAASVAWHHMGWEPVAFSEIEKFPSAVLAHHYPNVPNWGDMTKFKDWPDANLDVLVGGTPCQSFSVAGLRKGLDDPRGNLMLTFGAIAKRYRPQWLVWENVPGVLSSNGGRDFGAFLGMLAELGYGFAYRVLDAQFFGVAQRRRRVFVVGHLGDWHRAAAVLFERHSLSGHPAPSRKTRKGTAGGVAPSTTASGWPADVSPTLNAHFGSKQGLEDQHVNGGGGYLCQPVANCLTQRMYKGINTTLDEGQTPIVTIGGGFDGALTFKVRGGCEGGGKGYLGSEEAAFTVATTQDQWLAQPISFGAQMSVPQTDVDLVQTLQAKNPMAVMQPIPYDLYQITAPVNRQNRKPGDPCHTLARDNAAHAAVAYNITFCDANGVRSDRPNGGLYVNETDVSSTLTEAGVGTNVVQPVAGTLGNRGLRSHTELDGHGAYIPVAIQGTLIGRSENAGPQGSGADVSGAMFTLTKTDVHAVAIGTDCFNGQVTGDVAATMGTRGSSQNASGPTVMQPVAQFIGGVDYENNAHGMDEATGPLLKGSPTGGGRPLPAIATAMQVRRLTPVECERLQGFPDGYTNIPWRGKPESPDGPRYKALGNSMAVPVMRWIGERINEVNKL